MTPPLHHRILSTFFNAFAWHVLQPDSLSCGVCGERFHHIGPAEQHFKEDHPDRIAHYNLGEGEK